MTSTPLEVVIVSLMMKPMPYVRGLHYSFLNFTSIIQVFVSMRNKVSENSARGGMNAHAFIVAHRHQRPAGSILLFEDVDALFKGRSTAAGGSITFSTLLNALDGIPGAP